jgi:hypothetical protein
MEGRGAVRRSIVNSKGTAKQAIMLRGEMTTLMILAMGTLTESCITPGLARVGLIWHKQP